MLLCGYVLTFSKDSKGQDYRVYKAPCTCDDAFMLEVADWFVKSLPYLEEVSGLHHRKDLQAVLCLTLV
jgi:hypothetical protein